MAQNHAFLKRQGLEPRIALRAQSRGTSSVVSESADVIAVVKAGHKLYSARIPVKVTIGGCG